MEQLEIRGLRVAFERAGTGPPLLLLHGAFDDSRYWRRQLEALADEFTVVAWDAPGCGKSADPPEGFSPRAYVYCLAGLIGELGLGRVSVLGLSLGSMHALELYRVHPDVVSSLILASAYAGWAGSLSTEETERRTREVLAGIASPAQFIPRFLDTLLPADAPAELRAEVAEQVYDFHPAGARTMFEAWAPLDLRPVLSTIAVPTLVLSGEFDERSPVSVAEDLHASISGSRLVVLDGVGHLLNLEAPQRFNDEVRAFLRAQHV